MAMRTTTNLNGTAASGLLREYAPRPFTHDDAAMCVHGNPNVLTRDAGTSRLAQGCTGQLTSVEVERFTGNLPPVRAFDPPA